MDGLDFMTTLIGYGTVKNATLKIDGKPHNFGYKAPMTFSDWVHGLKDTDPRTIDGIIRFPKHYGGGGFIITKGVATPIGPVGGPRKGDVRRSFTVSLRSDVDAWIASHGNIAETMRRLIDRAYRDHKNNGEN